MDPKSRAGSSRGQAPKHGLEFCLNVRCASGSIPEKNSVFSIFPVASRLPYDKKTGTVGEILSKQGFQKIESRMLRSHRFTMME